MIAQSKLGVLELSWVSYCEASRVSIPLVIRFGYISQEVELFRRIVQVDISRYTVNRTPEIVATVFDAP